MMPRTCHATESTSSGRRYSSMVMGVNRNPSSFAQLAPSSRNAAASASRIGLTIPASQVIVDSGDDAEAAVVGNG